MTWLLYGAVAYIVADFVLAMVFKKCMLPMLRCGACKDD